MELFEYARLLKQHKDPNAREVREFVQRHQGDATFMERKKTLDAVFLLELALADEAVPAGAV